MAAVLLGLVVTSAGADHGALDPRFGGGDGVLVSHFPGLFAQDAAGAVRQPGGRIVVAGGSKSSAGADERFVLAAYDPHGRPDGTFGTDGRVATHFTGSGGERANALLRDSQGRLVAAGQVDGDPDIPVKDQFGVVGYTADGAVDTEFATAGGIRIGFFAGRSAQANAIAEQPDGKLVIAGGTQTAAGSRFALTRLLPDGKGRDPSFGADGRVTTSMTPQADFETISAIAMAPGDRIVVAGEAGGQLAVARYTPEGTLDPSFDGDGMKLLRFSDRGLNSLAQRATGLAVEPNGRIVATGDATFSFFDRRMLGVRLLPSGAFDPAWNGSGFILVDFTSLVADRRALAAAGALVRSGDGRYLIGGGVDLDPDRSGDSRSRRRFALIRLTSHGRLDRGFGGDGRVVTQLPTTDESISALLRQPDGLVVAAGRAQDHGAEGDPADIGLARYHALRDTDAPALRLRPAAGTSPAAVARAGRLALDAVAGEAQTAALTLTLGRVTLVRATVVFGGAGERRLSLTLTAAGRRALAGATTASIRITRSLTDRARNRRRDRVTIVLR